MNKIALSNMLTRAKLIHAEAGDGAEALEVLRANNAPGRCCAGIKLVLMDCNMPIMDGITAAKEIGKMIAEKTITHTTIVAVSADADCTIESQCIQAGMKEYIPKPINISKLYDCIARHLNA